MNEWNVEVAFAGQLAPDIADDIRGDWSGAGEECFVSNDPMAEQFRVSVASQDGGPDKLGVIVKRVEEIVQKRMPSATTVAWEAMTLDEFHRRAAASNLPRLVSVNEAAEILGVKRQRVHQLFREQDDFPTPLYEFEGGVRLWAESAIKSYARKRSTRPGRRPVS